ncbi:MAG TPA: hypothetical protein VJB35_06645 [Candidatus Nanoarchaeia archaeon]|nr:hypothetical protein [Candidatus Nanoarchaeia archaeon]
MQTGDTKTDHSDRTLNAQYSKKPFHGLAEGIKSFQKSSEKTRGNSLR